MSHSRLAQINRDLEAKTHLYSQRGKFESKWA